MAYINAQGSLIRHYPKMTFTEALSTLGVTGATNSITQRFTYARDRSSMSQRKKKKKGQVNGEYMLKHSRKLKH